MDIISQNKFLDELFDKSLPPRGNSHLGLCVSDLRRRLSQIILIYESQGEIYKSISVERKRYVCFNSGLCFKDDALTISLALATRLVFHFFLFWFSFLVIGIFSFVTSPLKPRRVVLIDDDLSFFDFEYFKKNESGLFDNFFILDHRSKDISGMFARSFVHKKAKLVFLLLNRFSVFGFWSFLYNHIYVLFYFIKKVFSNRIFVLLYKDLSLHSLIIHSENLKYVLRSNSCYSNQELWLSSDSKFKKYQLYHVWYSINSRPILTKEILDKLKSSVEFNLYGYFLFYSDINLAWNPIHKDWLDTLPYSGRSILDRVQKGRKAYKNYAKPFFDIMIFDITPQNQKHLFSTVGDFFPLYTVEAMKLFLKDIIELAVELDLVVCLKQKRIFNKTVHNGDYVDFVDELVSRGKLSIFNGSEASDAIQQSVLSICIPFTSPYFIACELDARSIFYDPLDIIPDDFFDYSGLYIVKNKIKLKQFLSDTFG